jgi:glycosyltransferase involved in cell wall biosynthesis
MTVVHVLEPFASGITTTILNITQQVKGVQHIVVHGSRTGSDTVENTKKKFPQDVRFIEWSSAVRELNPVRDLRAFKELLHILRPFREDDTVIHLHSSKAGFLGRAACGILGISAVIYTPHGASFIRTDTGKLKRSFFRLLERVGGFFGGTVVGCGPSEAALYSGLGKPALWIANGVPITPERKDPVSGLIVFTGIATAQKDPAFFNRVAEALSGVKEAAFCWVGDGPLRDSLRAGNIKVTGWQDRRTVEDYLSRALVYFSASAWEGLPYGVLEAMNASCALLLRNVPGNRELVIPGENGRLFDTEEEAAALLAEMLKNRQKTLDMGARSRLLAESRYSAVLMGEKYQDLYKAVSAGDISHLVPSGNHASCGAA